MMTRSRQRRPEQIEAMFSKEPEDIPIRRHSGSRENNSQDEMENGAESETDDVL